MSPLPSVHQRVDAYLHLSTAGMSSNRERHLFTVYPAPKAAISKADFQRLMFKRAKVLALASVLDGASGGLLDVTPQAAGQPDSFAAAPGAAGVVLEEQQQQQHLEAAQRRGHLIQSRREVHLVFGFVKFLHFHRSGPTSSRVPPRLILWLPCLTANRRLANRRTKPN